MSFDNKYQQSFNDIPYQNNPSKHTHLLSLSFCVTLNFIKHFIILNEHLISFQQCFSFAFKRCYFSIKKIYFEIFKIEWHCNNIMHESNRNFTYHTNKIKKATALVIPVSNINQSLYEITRLQVRMYICIWVF